MNCARGHIAATVWNGKILICGTNDHHWNQGSVECFDLESSIWTKLNMNGMSYPHSMVHCGNKLFVIGFADTRSFSIYEMKPLRRYLSHKHTIYHRCNSVAALDEESYVFTTETSKNGFPITSISFLHIFNDKEWRQGSPLPNNNYSRLSSATIPQHFADHLCR